MRRLNRCKKCSTPHSLRASMSQSEYNSSSQLAVARSTTVGFGTDLKLTMARIQDAPSSPIACRPRRAFTRATPDPYTAGTSALATTRWMNRFFQFCGAMTAIDHRILINTQGAKSAGAAHETANADLTSFRSRSGSVGRYPRQNAECGPSHSANEKPCRLIRFVLGCRRN